MITEGWVRGYRSAVTRNREEAGHGQEVNQRRRKGMKTRNTDHETSIINIGKEKTAGLGEIDRSAPCRTDGPHRAARLVTVLLWQSWCGPHPRPCCRRLVYRRNRLHPRRLVRDMAGAARAATATHPHESMCMRKAVRHRGLQRRLVDFLLLLDSSERS